MVLVPKMLSEPLFIEVPAGGVCLVGLRSGPWKGPGVMELAWDTALGPREGHSLRVLLTGLCPGFAEAEQSQN